MTEAVALAGLVVAVVGWVATGVLNRRSVRRTTRIDYLLSAYRRLDGANHRGMDVAREADLESVIADIQLLGTRQQVALADQFARDFATVRSADPGPLLEDLRRTLRRDLLLDRVPDREVCSASRVSEGRPRRDGSGRPAPGRGTPRQRAGGVRGRRGGQRAVQGAVAGSPAPRLQPPHGAEVPLAHATSHSDVAGRRPKGWAAAPLDVARGGLR